MGTVACVLFVNNENKILLYLRNNKPGIPYPNTWAMLGGHSEPGETIIDCLKREIKEEINYDLKNSRFMDKFEDGAGNEVYVHISEIEMRIDELKLKEGQKLGFFYFDEIINLNIPEKFRKFLLKNKYKIINDVA